MLLLIKERAKNGKELYFPINPAANEFIKLFMRPGAVGLNRKQIDYLIKNNHPVEIINENPEPGSIKNPIFIDKPAD